MQKVNRRQRQTEKDHAKNAIDNRVKHPMKRLLSIFSRDVFIYRILRSRVLRHMESRLGAKRRRIRNMP